MEITEESKRRLERTNPPQKETGSQAVLGIGCPSPWLSAPVPPHFVPLVSGSVLFITLFVLRVLDSTPC